MLCDSYGIHLYHIPELESERDKTTLAPFWTSTRSHGGWYRGSLCLAGSPNPTLYVHRPRFVEIVEFCLDRPSRFFVVTTHDKEKGVRRYGNDSDEVADRDVVLRGRKVLSYDAESNFLTFTTALLDRRDAGRVLRTGIANFHHGFAVDVSMVDLDEWTGRLLIAADYSTTMEEIQTARCVYLADLPE